jgi:hypothetical protein
VVLALGKEQITTEERLMDIISGVNETKDPEGEALQITRRVQTGSDDYVCLCIHL